MKNIKDLKEDILNKTAGNLFVFNGEEWAIKKHYINKIAEDYKKVKYVKDTFELSDSMVSKDLFKRKTLYVVPHDLEFLKATTQEFESMIKRILSSTDGAIWVYSTEIPKQFASHFDKYMTDFEVVEPDIFEQLVLHEIHLLPNHVQYLCHHCNRNYGLALMEIDKIKNYAQSEGVSNDVAFEDLLMNKMLVEEKDKFNCSEFMNHFLIGDFRGLAPSLKCLYDTNFENIWFYLEEMVQDLKIAYCFVKYGKYEGAKIAFDSEHLFWGRIKELRDSILFTTDGYKKPICLIPYDAECLQWLILQLSGYDNLAKQGKITGREVIENMFYYDV